MIFIGAGKWKKPGIIYIAILPFAVLSIFFLWASFFSGMNSGKSSISPFVFDSLVCDLFFFPLLFVRFLFMYRLRTSVNTKKRYLQDRKVNCHTGSFTR